VGLSHLGYGRGIPSLGGRRLGGSRRGDAAAQEHGEKSERRLLTALQNLGEGTGGGGVVAEEIELGRPSLGGGGVARSGVGRRGSGHQVLVRRSGRRGRTRGCRGVGLD
jgi:hypothetical protein